MFSSTKKHLIHEVLFLFFGDIKVRSYSCSKESYGCLLLCAIFISCDFCNIFYDNNLLNGTPAVYQNQAVLTVWGSLYRFIQCGGGSFLFLPKRFGAAVFFVYLRAEILIFYRAVI